MATTNDIDTKSAVRKFLESRAVVDKEDKTADSADEVRTVLESVALSFLLYPQAALSFVLKAKNVLQQIVSTDLEILQYILDAIGEIDNPDEPITDTSDLVEAQTALVEVDRLGRVSSDIRAYDRYTQAIDRFLDKQLGKFLKRRRRGEFERTGIEAKQDLFRVLSAFAPTHALMMERLNLLIDSVSDFQSVSLTRIVSTKALTRVRNSLNKVILAVNKDQISKTATAIELLAGSAALSSISNTRQVYDPTVDTGTHPAGRSISVRSEVVAAVATGTGTETDLSGVSTPWTFGITVDPLLGGSVTNVVLPTAGASGRSYVKAAFGSPTYDISPSNCTLYVQFDGIVPPYPEAAMVRAVTLPNGSGVTVSAILTALNDGVTGLIDGTAVQLGTTGKILIYGSASVTGITILSQVPGTFDGLGNYSDAPGSVHAVLGFSDYQQSGDPDVFTPADIVDLVGPLVVGATFSVEDDVLQIESNTTSYPSSLSFSGVAGEFGFSTTEMYIVEPAYLELMENGEAIDPTSLGIFIGSVVSLSDVLALPTKNLFAPITDIQGTRLFFDSGLSLPRVDIEDNPIIRIVSPLVFAVQSLLLATSAYKTDFDGDARELQRVLSPLLSRPTLAQISDAIRSIEAIKDKVTELHDILAATVVRSDRSEFEAVAQQITAALEERGLDRALELLQSCQFSAFFSLTMEEASKGSRFLKASEEVGRNDLAQTTAEQDIDESEPKGTTSDENLLPGEELLEDEEQI